MQVDNGSDLPANSGTKAETELCSEEIELQCNLLVPIGATKQNKLNSNSPCHSRACSNEGRKTRFFP